MVVISGMEAIVSRGEVGVKAAAEESTSVGAEEEDSTRGVGGTTSAGGGTVFASTAVSVDFGVDEGHRDNERRHC